MFPCTPVNQNQESNAANDRKSSLTKPLDITQYTRLQKKRLQVKLLP